MNKAAKLNEGLDEEKIKSGLTLSSLNLLSKLEIFQTIDSTNTYLLKHSRQKGISGWVCFAEEQSHGRGRQGRTWYSPKGSNIYCSVLWDFSNKDVSSLSIAVGVMVLEALQKYGVTRGLQLKWPNDILFAERKLGGILLERTGSFVVIGIGLNVFLSQKPEDLLFSATDLTEVMSESVNRNVLASLLVNELLIKLQLYSEQGLNPFIHTWRQHDILLNRKITISTPGKVFSGEMRGINEKGELLMLDEQNHLQSFCYGEVSVRFMS